MRCRCYMARRLALRRRNAKHELEQKWCHCCVRGCPCCWTATLECRVCLRKLGKIISWMPLWSKPESKLLTASCGTRQPRVCGLGDVILAFLSAAKFFVASLSATVALGKLTVLWRQHVINASQRSSDGVFCLYSDGLLFRSLQASADPS